MLVTAIAADTVSRDDSLRRLKAMIRDKSLLRGDAFKLSSGVTTDYFFNMKMTMLDPQGANLIATVILDRPEVADAEIVGGMVMGAVPIVSVVSARSFFTNHPLPAFFVRKELKGHGTNKLIEGYCRAGSRAILVDDVTTTGGSVMTAVRAARAAGCIVDTVITVVDRLEGAEENLASDSIRLVPIFTRRDFES